VVKRKRGLFKMASATSDGESNNLKFEELRVHFFASSKHSANDYTSIDASCLLCKKKVSYSNRSSYNLKRHLQVFAFCLLYS
jgi:BED zinc finger